MSVANMKSGEYHFFCHFFCNLPAYNMVYMVELVLCLIIQRFLPFLEYKFVNNWFLVSVCNFCIGYVF